MNKTLTTLLMTLALAAPIALTAQDRDRQERHEDKPMVYEDGRHHDTHNWNDDEDRQYRAYLQEHHRKYREFNKLNRKEQENYWNWRHQH